MKSEFTPQAPIRVGFVGLSTKGWASTVLGPALALNKDKYDLVALSTRSKESSNTSAETYSEKFGHQIKAYHGSVPTAIANDAEVDLVAVSISAPHHKDAITPALEAKKDIFCEWPVGTTTQVTEEIAQAVKSYGGRSIVGLQGRHSRALQKVKEIIASGKIGAIRSSYAVGHIPQPILGPCMRAEWQYIAKKENGITVLSVPLGHFLDNFKQVLGPISSVSATATHLYKTTAILDASLNPTGETTEVDHPDHYTIAGNLKGSNVPFTIFYRIGYKLGPGRLTFVWEIDAEDGVIRLSSNDVMGALTSQVDLDLFVNGEKVDILEGSEVTAAIYNASAAWQEFSKGPAGHHATIEDAVKHRHLLDAIEQSIDQQGKSVIIQ